MSFGVDTLAGLTEKLKQLINDTQNNYESFIDSNQLFKKGKINEREFFAKIGDYLVATSAMNFLAVRVIIEMKNAMDKGTAVKNPTGGSSTSGTQQAGFGIGGFVNTGGSVGSQNTQEMEGPKLVPVEIDLTKDARQESSSREIKNCIACGSQIPNKAKFCSKCGKLQ